ncbi:MAG: hypothetical protein QUU85_07720 [Candidatus Eisenbacteria bacterium]|nr:hypothetical protein [Candidatus Eisenbacteria bacterium]
MPYNLSVGDPGDEGKYKTAGARAYVRPIREGVAKGWGIGGYAQYAPQVPDAGDNNTVWYGAHSFYEGKKLAAGVQYDARRRKFALLAPNDGTDEVTSQVISGLARYAFNEKIEAFARVDLVDYDTDADDLELVSPGFGDITDAAAQTVLFAGVSQAYSNSLRSVLDVRYRTLNDDVFVLGEKIDLDNEIVVSLRLDARL